MRSVSVVPRRVITSLWVVALIITLQGFGLASASVPESILKYQAEINFVEYELDNGLEVILVEDHSAPTVAVDVWYDVGGANDPPDRSGFAHLFEHMMFQGSANLDKLEHGQRVEAVGGSLNAYTTTERTAYWEALPSHQLPLGLWLEAERMSSLAVTTENLNNQRAVVIEEFQLRVGNAPYGEAVETFNRLSYDYPPYQQGTIGSIEQLNASLVDEIRDFHATYYLPNNATLVVAGDFDVEATRALIDAYFAPIPGGDLPPELPVYEPSPRTEPELLTLEDPLANIPASLTSWIIPAQDHEDFPALAVLSQVLSSGDSSRLAQLMLDTGLAASASTGVSGNRGPGLYTLVLLPNAGVELDQLEAIYDEEIERILADGVDSDELDKAINRIRSGRLVGLETSFNLAESVQSANFYFDDPQALFTVIERFAEVTSDDIQRVITDYLAPQGRFNMTVLPGAASGPRTFPEPVVNEPGADENLVTGFVLEQTTPPDPLPVSEFNLPEITESILDNGLEVVVINRPELPIISLDLVLPGGGSGVSEDKAGLAGIVATTLTRGTTSRSAQDIAREIEQVGGVIGAFATDDRLNLGVFALIEDVDLAFDLLGDVALNPSFPQEEIDIALENSLTGLRFSLAQPGTLASRAFDRLIWGDHPYGHVTTEGTLTNLTREDVVNYYNEQFDPDSALLIVAGDIMTEEALALAEATFGGLDSDGIRATPELPEPATPPALNLYVVDRPGSTQVDFLIGNLAINGSHPDRYKLAVMNDILGGGFSSRLFGNVREDKGFAYSIGSAVSTRVNNGVFIVRTAVRTEDAAAALREIIGEVERLQTETVTAEELQRTKDSLIGSMAVGLETYQSFVNQVASYKLNGLPIDTLSAFPDNIAAVAQADVMSVAQTYLLSEHFVVVAVGEASAIVEQLEAVAPVTLLEAE